MPYVPTQTYKQWGEFREDLDKQGREIESQKRITFFFTIIAGMTLVAVLVSTVSLFFIFFSDYISTSKTYTEKTYELKKELDQVGNEILMLKANNPYLK